MKKFLLIFLTLILTQQCVKIDDFEAPGQKFEEPQLDGEIIQIASVKGGVAQNTEGIITFKGVNTYMEGYVISSDEGGNFFEELILQDKPENPTAGISVLIDESPLFTRFDFGRKVYVKLDGLTATASNGVISLGLRDGIRLEKIPASLLNEYVIRSQEVAEITPLKTIISEFSEAKENLYIQLSNMQFRKMDVLGESRNTFAAEGTDKFDGERVMESCDNPTTAILSTSTFSDFKALLLPKGNGNLNGILSRDFYDKYFVLAINAPVDIDFGGTRCARKEVSCGKLDREGTKILFAEDFEQLKKNKPVKDNGWVNYVQEGSNVWEAYTAVGGNASLGISARLNPSKSGDASSINWLVTPAIDLLENLSARLRFQSSTSFANSSVLEVLASADWDGDPETISQATWQLLTDPYVAQNMDFFGDWPSSGVVDIGCLSGVVHIAFRYTGSSRENFDGVYELDNIRITAD